MQVSMNARGNEMYIDSRSGRYTAHAPVTPDKDGKFYVTFPSGKTLKMTQAQWLNLIAYTSMENGLVRQPKNDCFSRGV